MLHQQADELAIEQIQFPRFAGQTQQFVPALQALSGAELVQHLFHARFAEGQTLRSQGLLALPGMLSQLIAQSGLDFHQGGQRFSLACFQ